TDLVKESQVFIEGGHELCQTSAFQTRSALAVADHHAFSSALDHDAHELTIVLDVLKALALLNAIERRLCDEYVATLDEVAHVAEEEGEQQSADVRAVYVSIGHEDDFSVAQLEGIKILFADAGSQRSDHSADFFMAQHLVVAGLLHVEDLAFQRQNCLKAAIAALLGGASGGFTFDQKQLAAAWIALRAISEFARQASTIQCAFASSKVAGFARRFTCPCSFDGFVDNPSRYGGILFEEGAQTLIDERLYSSGNIRIQLALGLAFELRLWQLYADHGYQSFANVVAGEIFFYVLEQAELLAGVVDGAGQRRPETGEGRAAVHGVDVVGKAEDGFRVAVVVLQSDFHLYAITLGFHVDGPVVQDAFAPIQVLDELSDTAGVFEFQTLSLAGLGVSLALISQRDLQAVIQEGQFAQALGQRIEVIFRDGQDFLVRKEMDLGAAFFGSSGFPKFTLRLALGIGLLPDVAFAPNFEIELMAERIDYGDANAVQSARDFVAGGIELSARMQLGEHHLGRRKFLAIDNHVIDRNAAAIVHYSDGVIDVDGYIDARRKTGKRFVDGIVHHFINQVMETHFSA